MRVVLDTCVMVAALRSDRGASRQLLLAAFARRYVLLASVPLMMEYEAVLVRPEHLEPACLSAGDVNEILAALAATVEPVRLAFLWRPMLRDPADEMILETAANGRADLLVTFNIRHFTQVAGRFGIDVVSPPEAWRRLRKVQ